MINISTLKTSVDSTLDKLIEKLNALRDSTSAHEYNSSNPHQVTKEQVGLDAIPNSVTIDRTLDSTNSLLTAKAMHDHVLSSDHDTRYYIKSDIDNLLVNINTTINAKIAISDIVDDLVTDDSTKVLSASKGKALQDAIVAINTLLQSDDSTLDQLQEIVNYIKLNRQDLQNLSIANINGLQDSLNTKVDKVVGKSLTDVNFSQADKDKLDTIEANATATGNTDLSITYDGVNIDINNSTGTGVSLLPADNLNSGLFTSSLFQKLNTIQQGAQVNPPIVTTRDSTSGSSVLAAKVINEHIHSQDHDNRYTTTVDLTNLLSTKVDIVLGKDLSTNDYTTEEKTKLANIEDGAEVNVGTNLSSAATIENITIYSSTGGSTVLPKASISQAGVMTATAYTKLSNIADNAEANVPTDLSITARTSDVEIQSSTGTNAILQSVTNTEAGVMLPSDKVKLDGIATGANLTPTQVFNQTATVTNITFTNNLGDNIVLQAADSSNIGLMLASDKDKLDQIDLANITEKPTTYSRTIDSTTDLFVAKGMYDHVLSGDHDSRYVLKDGDTIVGELIYQGLQSHEGDIHIKDGASILFGGVDLSGVQVRVFYDQSLEALVYERSA